MSTKRVKATLKGYAPREPGMPCDRIDVGDEIVVVAKATAKWWEELEAPVRRGRPPKDEAPGAE